MELMLGSAAVTLFAQQEQPQFQGAASCARCHEDPSSTDTQSGITARACLTEWKTWSRADRHALAYDALKSERGKRIGELLGKKSVFDAQTGCVQCHTTTIDAVRADANRRDSILTEGVGCESCHGPSSQWESKHNEHPTWREMASTAEGKQQQFDMGWIDVRSAVTRAEVCASCHIGSAEENRRITHDMYAAGHPPLSDFEIESYAEQMPRHWRYSYEQPDVKVASYEHTRNVLIGSVVALRVSVKLAMADAAAPREQNRWPELARLECFACHHELVEPSWRQSTGSVAAAGRPQLAVGCFPLFAVAAEIARDSNHRAFNAIAGMLRQPFATNIFGDPKLLAQQGEIVVRKCESLERYLMKLDFDSDAGQRAARAVLRAITRQAAATPYDYDTSRQLLGAWRIVYDELVTQNALPFSASELEKVRSIVQPISGNLADAALKSPCDAPPELTAEMKLDREKLQVEVLRDTFASRITYDPAQFTQVMKELDALIGK
jgi:hypothetical protein